MLWPAQRFQGKFFSYVILIPFVFSGGLIPYYLTLFRLGLINTFWVFVLPGLFNIWNMFVMRQFFTEIPESLKEAAIIEGANESVTLMRMDDIMELIQDPQ